MARRQTARAAVASTLLFGIAVAGGSAGAQEATPAGGAPVPEGCEVVADGLMNPRQLAFDADGTLYVTESGMGGDEEVAPPQEAEEEAEEVIGSPAAEAIEEAEEAATPSPGEAEAGPGGPVTRGDTGQVTAVAPDGTQSVVATGLPSTGLGAEAVGPTGIVVADGQIWVANGGAALELGIEPLPNENSVVQIDPDAGEATLVADLGAYEEANNPDGTDVNPNLYGMDLGADGQLYVADAGGNTLFRVDPASGTFALLGVVPERPVPAELAPPPGATPEADMPTSLQAVPTAVHVGDDGNVYVGLLGGLAPGAGAVVVAQADGTFIDTATGMSAVVGVALGPDGSLYASQISNNFFSERPEPGSVVRIDADGNAEPVLEDLMFPNGIAFDEDGSLYVVVNSVSAEGQVLRCEGIAAGQQDGTPSAGAAVAARLVDI